MLTITVLAVSRLQSTKVGSGYPRNTAVHHYRGGYDRSPSESQGGQVPQKKKVIQYQHQRAQPSTSRALNKITFVEDKTKTLLLRQALQEETVRVSKHRAPCITTTTKPSARAASTPISEQQQRLSNQTHRESPSPTQPAATAAASPALLSTDAITM